MKKIGILYHPKLPAAIKMAEELADEVRKLERSAWVFSAWEEEEARTHMEGSTLAICIGGDGTILRVARAAAPWGVPILGINMGKLGFLAEVSPKEVHEKLHFFVAGGGWLDERAMLEATWENNGGNHQVVALNDVVVVRGGHARVVYIRTLIDGSPLTTYKADGLIVATATGSTGYSLASGGPIVYPQAKDIVLNPISPHLTLPYSLIVPSTATVDLQLLSESGGILSVDGQKDFALNDGDKIVVRQSPYVAKFLRAQPPNYFYSSLLQRLAVANQLELVATFPPTGEKR